MNRVDEVDPKHWWMNRPDETGGMRRAIIYRCLVAVIVGAAVAPATPVIAQDELRTDRSATIAALRLAAEAFPDSTAIHEQLGKALLQTGRYEDAIASYRRSLAIEPFNPSVAKRIDWIRGRARVELVSVVVPVEILERYVGDYHTRHVSLRGGMLYFRGDGDTEYRLIPLTQETFALDGLETFRIWFVVEGRGPATKIIGLYFNGRSDETIRAGLVRRWN